MKAFFLGLVEVLSWPRHGRRNLAIAVLTVTELGALVAGITLTVTGGGFWWIAPIIAVVAYAFTGFMVGAMNFMELIDHTS